MSKNLTKEVHHALEWLAAEFKYLRLLHQGLERIENSDLDDVEKELKKDVRTLRFVGRSERRLDKDVSEVLDDLHQAKETELSPEELKSLFDELEVPAHQLVGEGSLYVGNQRN